MRLERLNGSDARNGQDTRRVALFPPMGAATAAALFHGVPGGPPAPRARELWAADMATIIGERLAELALSAAREVGMRFDEETASVLNAASTADAARSLSVERATPEVIRRLRIRRVPAVITNGLGTGEALPSPAPGAVCDVEVLVPPDRFLVALRTLSAMGFVERPLRSQPRSYFTRVCREGVSLVHNDGTSIDLFHHVRPWVWGDRLPFAELAGRAQGRAMPGGTVPVAHPTHSLLIGALSLIGDSGKPGRGLGVWRDLLGHSAACDPAEVSSVARTLGLDWILAILLREVPHQMRPVELLRRLSNPQPSGGDAFRLRRLFQPVIGSRPQVVQVFRLPVPNAGAFIAGSVLPSTAFLEQRFGSRVAYYSWWRDAFLRPRQDGYPIGGKEVAELLQPIRVGTNRRHAPGDLHIAGGWTSGGRTGSQALQSRRTSTLFPHTGPTTTAALFHGVNGAPTPPTGPQAWDEELTAILEQRLGGLALAAALRCGAALHPATLSRLRDAQLMTTATALSVESTALAVLASLDERGIPFVVTKGPGIADTYPQRSLRPFGDVDVLVPPECFDLAMRALHGLGFEEYFEGGEPRSYFDRRCREGVNLIREDGASIDLHHHVPPWVWGERLGFAELVAASRLAEVAGGRIRIVHPIHNLLIAALHVISDRRVEPGDKLLTWRDVVSLAHACEPDAVVREARRVDLDWYLAFILEQLPSYVRPISLMERLGRPESRMPDRFRLRRLLPPAIGSRHQIAQAFRLPVPNAAAFLVGYVFPSSVFLERRFGSRSAYLRWWRDALLRLRAAGHPVGGGPPLLPSPGSEALATSGEER